VNDGAIQRILQASGGIQSGLISLPERKKTLLTPETQRCSVTTTQPMIPQRWRERDRRGEKDKRK